MGEFGNEKLRVTCIWISRAFAVATPIVAAYETKKALDAIHAAQPQTKFETFKVAAPKYIGTAACVAIGIAADILSENETNKTLTAMSAASTALKETIKLTENTAKEFLTEEKKKEFDAKLVDALHAAKIPPKLDSPVLSSLHLFEDVRTGIQFYSDADHIRKVREALEEKRMLGVDVTLVEFYEAIGIDDPRTLKEAEGLVWMGAKQDQPWTLDRIRLELYYGSDTHRNPVGYIKFITPPRTPNTRRHGITGAGTQVYRYEL